VSSQVLGPIVHSSTGRLILVLKKNDRTEEQGQTEKTSRNIILVPLSGSVPLYPMKVLFPGLRRAAEKPVSAAFASLREALAFPGAAIRSLVPQGSLDVAGARPIFGAVGGNGKLHF
jgi:hypothetical protein